ncbi:Alpha/Beta hydrolase protein [Irpex rosettiformis]|uniref:Alpha/Beta hydrolase protein n=1 Tax=Irpex rosettiformis TaxID=378272 RepID=A0ACB8UD37_9APHY|nr:Alpha/Beta hydrolase protein [Irpex rosettiformis]
MPSVTVNPLGIELYYEDSGAPAGSTSYSTVFLIHGYYCHSSIFLPTFSHAKLHNFRFIAINMREYPGTTNLSEAELQQFASADLEDQAAAVASQAVDIARLIVHVIKQEGIPPPQRSGDTLSGGVSLMAWSAGTLMINALLANVPTLDKAVYEFLNRYVTNAIFYTAPNIAFGIADPPKTTYPLKNLTMSTEEAHDAFLTWISTYWQPFPDLKSINTTSIQQRKPMTEISSDPRYKSIRERRSPEEIEGIVHAPVKYRIGPALVNWQVFMANTRRALLDTKGTWKDVKVLIAWGEMGPWTVALAAKELTETLQEPAVEGQQRREVKFLCLKDASHFLPYDDPERFVKFLAENA